MKIVYKLWRFLALTLIAALLLAGCSTPATTMPTKAIQPTATTTETVIDNFNKTGFPIVNTPITLKVMGNKASTQGDWNKMNFFTAMTKLTGIKFTINAVATESFIEKRNLAFVSNDLPDLFLGGNFSATEQGKYGAQGALVSLNKHIDQYGAYLQAMFSEIPYAKALCTATDGNIYSLPRVSQTPRDMVVRSWICIDWIKKVGKKAPETLDEYYDLVVAFRDNDCNGNGNPSDEIPISGYGGSSVDAVVLSALGFKVTSPGSLFDEKDGKVQFIPTTEQYKYYLTYMRRLYKEKLLDNEVFTQNSQQFTAKGQEMRLGSFVSSASYLTVPREQSDKYIYLGPLTSQHNQKKMVPINGGIVTGVVAITSANKYPEATLRMIDYCYSREGSILSEVGEEGIGWEWVDKSKGIWQKIKADGYNSGEETRVAIITPAGCTPLWYPVDWSLGQPSTAPISLNAMTKQYYEDYFVYMFPSLFFTDEELRTVNPILTDIAKYVDEARARFIIGEDDIATGWESYVNSLNKMKADSLLKFYQNSYDRYNKALK